MPVLVFRHVPREPLGRISLALDTRGIEWRYVDLWDWRTEEVPVEQAQGLISMGGPMSVNDFLPWLRQEERYMARAISGAVPILGICLGAQLLAKCLGAQVYPMKRKEIGWYPVRFTEAAGSDSLLSGLEPEETVFQWHGETFELPAGSDRLAGSELCANQAFRAGSNLYGLQFHPEVTPEIIADWCRTDSSCGESREAEGPIDAFAHQDRAGEIAAHIFGRWCDLML